jgi:PKD repeat protein
VAVLQGDPPGLVISDNSVSVTNAQERMIGPFPANFFADPTTGLATVTHSFTTTVTSGIFKLSQP